MTVIPGEEYRLLAQGERWEGGWRLRRPGGEAGGAWSLDGPGFDGFGLGPVSLSVAHWRAFGMVIEYLTLRDADPLKTVVLEDVAAVAARQSTTSPSP
ncbi:MAG TPA: hypothetical protein VIL36_12370 [Acidimicrobiales bacterium]